MKRIIAGGTGFIGRHLVEHWLAMENQLIIIGRDKNKIQKLYGDRVSAMDWTDVKRANTDLLRDVGCIVNLTGVSISEGRWTEARKAEIISSRINSTKTLANICAIKGRSSPPLFNAGGVGIYGAQTETREGLPPSLDENTRINYATAPDFLALVGRQWEQATEIAKTAGVRVVNLRFGVVLAKDGGALPKIALPFYFFLGGTMGSGRQPIAWITLVDLIAAIDLLLQSDVNGPVNLVAPECVTQREFAKTLAKVLHRPCCVPTPAFVLKAIFGNMAKELLLSGQHVAPTCLLQTGFQFQYPDLSKALQMIYAARD
jgi:hypothetical protein